MKRFILILWAVLAAPGIALAAMAENVARKKIEGIDAIVYQTAVQDVVTIVGALPAGTPLALANHDNAAVAVLTSMMLDRGTVTEDKFAITRKLDSVGATVRFVAREQMLFVQARCLKKDLPLVLQLTAEQLRSPAFSQQEFERARQQYIGKLQNQIDDVSGRAAQSFKRAIYPPGHPNYEPSIDEYLSAAQALTVDEVKAFHRKHYGPAHMTLVLVGDVTMARAQGALARAFRGWTGGVNYLRGSGPAGLTAPSDYSIAVEIPGKTSTILSIGQVTGLREKDPDTLALQVGTTVLGSGFTSRLMHAVRDQEGLTYGINAQLGDNTFSDGSWQIAGSFAPQLLERGTASAQRELQEWWEHGVTAQELGARQSQLVGSYQVRLSNTAGMAQTLISAVLSGRDVTWLDQYPKAVAALTLKDVNEAIKRHLNPRAMVVVKTGTLPPAP